MLVKSWNRIIWIYGSREELYRVIVICRLISDPIFLKETQYEYTFDLICDTSDPACSKKWLFNLS